MGDGKRAAAPCGHVGETVIGTYVACAICDRGAVPGHIDPEQTEPLWQAKRCPGCGSFDIEEFEDDIDAALWFMQIRRAPSSSPLPPQAKEWGCHGCYNVFPRPA